MQRKPIFAPNTPVEWIGVVQEGNKIMALVGEDIAVGAAGFGDTVPEALRELADQIEKEGWKSIISLASSPRLHVVRRCEDRKT